jgi:hypothetical protein
VKGRLQLVDPSRLELHQQLQKHAAVQTRADGLTGGRRYVVAPIIVHEVILELIDARSPPD